MCWNILVFISSLRCSPLQSAAAPAPSPRPIPALRSLSAPMGIRGHGTQRRFVGASALMEDQKQAEDSEASSPVKPPRSRAACIPWLTDLGELFNNGPFMTIAFGEPRSQPPAPLQASPLRAPDGPS